MAARFTMRPAYWVALALVLPPLYKVAEWSWPRGPKFVSPEVAAAGAVLFRHEFTPNDPLTGGDGLGPVFNARSCVECHFQGGAGGGGTVDKNVTVYGIATPETNGLPRVGVVHQKAVKKEYQELLSMVNPGLPGTPAVPLKEILERRKSSSFPTGIVVTQRNTPAIFGAGLIDSVSEDVLVKHMREHSNAARLAGLNGAKDPNVRGRVARLADGRIGRFGWKSEFSTLNDFVKAACANELGLSNPGRPQATPLPLARASYQQPGTDLTEAQCDLMTDYLSSLPKPVELQPHDATGRAQASTGKAIFNKIGCADCHSPTLGSVEGLYSDLLLHDMGPELESSTGYYGAIIPAPTVANGTFAASEPPVSPGEWRTAPLWGVADSAPYLHDGRAETLDDAIKLHAGEARDVTKRYTELAPDENAALISFLKTLHAPAVAATPSATTASK